ncbi:MAG: hypothetical protein JWQ21_1301, partial [Herminiimonas sp.]|nr:hypothetical protein [Herminiimonas sp.]
RLARNLGRVSAGKGECRIERAVALYDEQEVSLMVNSILEMYDAVTRYEPIMTLRDMNQQSSDIDIFASR